MTRAVLASLALLALLSAGCASGAASRPATEPEPARTSASGSPALLPTATPIDPAQPVQKTLMVGESLVDCQGEAAMKCMQVRETPDGEWTYFYEPIEGFEHEVGYRYELRVEVTKRAEPMADQSSLSYRLLEVVSKQRVGP